MGDNDKMKSVAKIYTSDVEVGSVAVPGTMRKDLSRRHINMIGLAVSCAFLAKLFGLDHVLLLETGLTNPTGHDRKLVHALCASRTLHADHKHQGTGLFLASGQALRVAGPVGALLGYILMSLLTASVALTTGELSSFMPVSGGFVRHATKFVQPALGAATGWNYWYL